MLEEEPEGAAGAVPTISGGLATIVSMAEKPKNQMAEHLRSRGMREAKVPEAERGVTTACFVLGRATARLRGKKRPAR